MGWTEGAEACLRSRGVVRITRIQWRSIVDQPQASIEVGLKQDVDVHVCSKIAAVTCQPRYGIDSVVLLRKDTVLCGKPAACVRKIVGSA